MLFKRATLKAIEAGAVTVAFRRWKRPTVRQGGTLSTAIGVLAIDAVDRIALNDATEADWKAAGHESMAELRAALAKSTSGDLYRIIFHLAGEDPRIALRSKSDVDADEMDEILTRLDRWDRASPAGPWTSRYLMLIDQRPAVRAPELADDVGIETAKFKANVRKLKSLGLTESLKVGYRLSPRGRAVLRRLKS